MTSQLLIAGWFTRPTQVGTIILGVGIMGVSLYDVVTGQCLLMTDLYGTKGRIVSALGLVAGVVLVVCAMKYSLAL